MKDRTVLIVGANRGLGQALAQQYADAGKIMHATARHSAPSSGNITWIPHIDITYENAGTQLYPHYLEDSIDVLIICAGYFAKETLNELNYEKQLAMYKTNAIGPTFLVSNLVRTGLLKRGSRIVLVGGESGSIHLHHEKFGGGNYGGHGSKAALNMCGKLLANDLGPEGISVSIVHTGYLRKQNLDGTYEAGESDNAVKPDEAATALRNWITTSFDSSKNGQLWSIRGPPGIRSAQLVLGENLPTPLQLPW